MNPSLSKLLRAHYRDLQPYISAGMEIPKDESRIFLNANENPFELPGPPFTKTFGGRVAASPASLEIV